MPDQNTLSILCTTDRKVVELQKHRLLLTQERKVDTFLLSRIRWSVLVFRK